MTCMPSRISTFFGVADDLKEQKQKQTKFKLKVWNP